MKKNAILFLASALALSASCRSATNSRVKTEIKLSKEVLMDKIKGGWAGQTIGCTYGGPTEFVYRGTMIQDYIPIRYEDHCIKGWFDTFPGLYDDIYMDLTFVKVFDQFGLDAPAEAFAAEFAHAGYNLWHANQAARYNILNGIAPPESGHWKNNPHADDIDFQIEADFAGLMSPGMANSAAHYADKIGHIMNYGDGWYGGVYVAAMYSLAFVYDDIETIVKEAIQVIPTGTRFRACMDDVLKWHECYPDDWKQTWAECEKKWSSDIGCPDGVFMPLDIESVINSAYVTIGLLYGAGDFDETLEISTRCGQDSDCNPATAGGILATMLGYSNIPEKWMGNLREVEGLNFSCTDLSLNKTYELSFRQALQVIEKNGGKIDGDEVTIRYQIPETVRYEQCFTDIRPANRFMINKGFENGSIDFDFTGAGLVISYSMTFNFENVSDYVAKVLVRIDEKEMKTVALPESMAERKNELYFNYELEDKPHHVELICLNPNPQNNIWVSSVLTYDKRRQ